MNRIVIQAGEPKELVPFIDEALENEKKILQGAISRTKGILSLFEKRYRMSSNTFFKLYQDGSLSDEIDYVSWSGEYKIFLKLKRGYKQLSEVRVCT